MRERTKLAAAILLGLWAAPALSQPDSVSFPPRTYRGITAGLGVSLVNNTDIVDFVSFQSGGTRQDDFTAAGEFFGAAEIQLSEEWGLKLEYSYLVKSYNIPRAYLPDAVFSYSVHMPTAVMHRVIPGNGYYLKFGGGGGYHIAHFTEDFSSASKTLSARGLGLKFEAEGNTAFDEHLYADISLDVRDDILGELKDFSGNPEVNLSSQKPLKMNFFSIGVKFGLSYLF